MDAVRYNLDSLGWYQFEWLVQVLLKAELGIGVESWGGRGDHGREAYSVGPLPFPARAIGTDGPFVFQCKFVESANAAGAKYSSLLLDSCKKEAARISIRIKKKEWKPPNYFVLVTNCPLTAKIRKEVEEIFSKSASQVSSLGGQDISDLLDSNDSIARSFPQILSLRSLKELLEDIVNKETLERSRAAVKEARDVVKVFVPTSAYALAWKTLREHSFAVLEGPPEMGKTAIAWMIALAQLANGWEAIVCDDPSDLFGSHRPSTSQVFVADDAFGRTEYDPTMVSRWEKQLPRVMKVLDDRHWLVWTSRRHILERARREMDLQGCAEGFPKPGDVLVLASSLTDEERALILYRHCKAASLQEEAKTLIKSNLKLVVKNPSFTPERIRRLVFERLPMLSKNPKMSIEALHDEIEQAIKNPTERMTKTFRALPDEHKWFLISLLEQGHSPDLTHLRNRFQQFTRGQAKTSFDDLLEELSVAFIKT
jgi:hypothetical protein